MGWVLHESAPFQHPPAPPPPPPPPLPQKTLGSKLSPSILLIIVILAVIFFVSGLLHLLVRYLLRPADREPDDTDNDDTVLQGRLQQLFHLHDAGVDQSFIDTLPVFLYKSITGLKDPFDCAVCLCEFEGDDRLRLLPKCSHAFHLECIDTWLLSHSTCPLCRRSLLPDFSPSNSCSPIVLVLESGSESSREMMGAERVSVGEGDLCPPPILDSCEKTGEVEVGSAPLPASEGKVVPVKLGKFRNADNAGGVGGEGTSIGSSNLDQRRCFSMGSYEYVMDERSLLRVSIKTSKKKPSSKKQRHRLAMSECDCHSRREGFRGFDPSRSSAEARSDGGDARIKMHKNESFSVSKIWLRSKEDTKTDCSRRAFSFRLPKRRQSIDDLKPICGSSSPRPASELGIAARWEKSGTEVEFDVETGSCNNSVGSLAEEAPSFARRTLLWIVGRQNRVGNHI